MPALDALSAAPRTSPPGRLVVVLAPVSHPELGPIRIQDSLFAVGRSEAPFDAYPPGLAADLSRRHARIFCEHGAVYFADLGSKNGSSVNGAPLRQGIATLHDGDLLGIGKTLVYRVQFDAAAPKAHAAPAKLASLVLHPEDAGGILQPIVVSGFPFMVSKADDTFARYKDQEPAQLNYLSRRHAHLFLKGGRLYVEDLGSTNGTFVNGSRLDEHAVALQEGDVLGFGGRYFVYRVHMQWEAAVHDPTLTVALSKKAAPVLDADRTTFVAAADSFLDIFCVDPAPAAADAADAPDASAPQEGKPEPQGRAATVLASLYTALGGKGPLPVRRLGRRGAVVLGGALLLGWALYAVDRPAREVEDLMAAGAYAQAAATAAQALASDPGDRRLEALGAEAVLKAHLPSWIAAVEAGQYPRAARQLDLMRRQARHNPGMAPLFEELDAILALKSFVAGRGGAQAAVRDAGDGARIGQMLEQWEEQNDARQRAYETISAAVPAFRDTYADALSDLRRLALARPQS